MTQKSGHMVMEFTCEGIPKEQLTPEKRTPLQELVLGQLEPQIQQRIRQGYPVAVIDFETEERIIFNQANIKPSKHQIDALAQALLPKIQAFLKDPKNREDFEKR